MPARRIVIVCAGGHGRIVADALRRAHEAGAGAMPIGFVDDTPRPARATVDGLEVFGPIASLSSVEHDAVIVALGDNAARRAMTERLVAAGERVATAIHPHACIASDVAVGDGAMISAGVIVSIGAKIGRGVLLNTKASVDHDTVVEDFAHVSAGATVGARAHIGSGSLIALGATVISGVRVGARTTIGAGSVVVNDIVDDVLALGIPARVTSSTKS